MERVDVALRSTWRLKTKGTWFVNERINVARRRRIRESAPDRRDEDRVNEEKNDAAATSIEVLTKEEDDRWDRHKKDVDWIDERKEEVNDERRECVPATREERDE